MNTIEHKYDHAPFKDSKGGAKLKSLICGKLYYVVDFNMDQTIVTDFGFDGTFLFFTRMRLVKNLTITEAYLLTEK